MLKTIMGIPVYISPYCYKTKVVVRGIADSRRPNNKKPFYRRVTIQVPHIIMSKEFIAVHPSLVDELENAIKEINDKPMANKWHDAMNILGYGHPYSKADDSADAMSFTFRNFYGGVPPRLKPLYYTGGA
jgi:hypothetical protein